MDELPIELTNTTGTHLLDINEDCLLEIFAVKSLSLMDLCSLAETCKRFQQIAQRVFPKDLIIKGKSIEYGVTSIASRQYLLCRPTHDIERIFKNFGTSLLEVHLAAYLVNNRHRCVEISNFLKIERLKIPANLKVILRPIFKRLHRLDLIDVDIVGGNETLFADLDSLIELRMIWMKNCNAIVENDFPKLERFMIKHLFSHQQPNIHSVTAFISKLTKLKTLDFVSEGGVCESGKQRIVEAISNSCKDLEELSLSVGPTNASHPKLLQELKSLKTLQLWRVPCEDFQFLSAFTKLRDLQLNWYDLPKDSNQFGALSELTKLCLRLKMHSDIDVVGVISQFFGVNRKLTRILIPP